MSAITADLFGVRHFGANLGFFLFAPILGSFAFASGVVDLFYVEGCSGSACYRYVFLTEAVACLVATVLCLFLKLRIMERFQVHTFVCRKRGHKNINKILRQRTKNMGSCVLTCVWCGVGCCGGGGR